MKYKNKWNGKTYTVLEVAAMVKLQREDGSEFVISKSEFYANYREVHDGKVDNN